jgi:hypothetical protein
MFDEEKPKRTIRTRVRMKSNFHSRIKTKSWIRSASQKALGIRKTSHHHFFFFFLVAKLVAIIFFFSWSQN